MRRLRVRSLSFQLTQGVLVDEDFVRLNDPTFVGD